MYGYTNISKINEDCVSISARGTIGYCEIRKAPFYPIVRLICACPNEKIYDIVFFKYLLKSIEFDTSGKVQQQLTVPEIENVKLNIPSLDKQKELSTKVSKKEKEIEKLMSKLVDFNNMKNDLIKKLIINE